MGAIASLSTAFDALRRNPVLFAAALFGALLGIISLVGQALGPLAYIALAGFTLLLGIFLRPFLTGGMVGISAEAIAGQTRFGTFLSEGKTNYVSLFGAYLLLFGIYLLVAILFAVIAFLFLLAGTFALAADGGGATGGVAGLGVGLVAIFVFLLFGFVMLVAAFLMQFFDTAVVVSDESATGSLMRSASFVRHNLVSTLGFNVIYIVLTFLALVPTVFVSVASQNSFASSDPTMTPMMTAGPGLVEMLPIVLVTLVVSTLISAFLWPYKVAFYTRQTDAATA